VLLFGKEVLVERREMIRMFTFAWKPAVLNQIQKKEGKK